jgi:hypothetical protein
MTADKKDLLMLVFLAHEMTVCARSTYEAGTDKVLEPEELRRFNEIQHRVTGAVRDHLLGLGGFPLADIIAMVRGFGDEWPDGGLARRGYN